VPPRGRPRTPRAAATHSSVRGPTIAGIGVDLCEIDRIERALGARHGARFRARVFTEGEQAYCEARRRGRFESYAARFAAKEAVMKVLGTGWSRGIGWRDVEVVRERGSAPALRLHGQAAVLARRLGMAHWLLTITHGRSTAIAWVLAERGRVSGGRQAPAERRNGAAAGSARSRPRARR
jgi:holo-[acyl-carrier protein] synthase